MLFIVARSVIHCHCSVHIYTIVCNDTYIAHICPFATNTKKIAKAFFKDLASRAHYDLVRIVFPFCNFQQFLCILGSAHRRWDGMGYTIGYDSLRQFFFKDFRRCHAGCIEHWAVIWVKYTQC